MMTKDPKALLLSEYQSELKNLNILIVDDNEINREIALDLIQEIGHTADLAINGQDAIYAQEKKSYHIIFMDMQMPILDGVNSAKKILQQFTDKGPYIIAMTANTSEKDKKKCFDAGMRDCITKPFDIDDFSSAIVKYILS